MTSPAELMSSESGWSGGICLRKAKRKRRPEQRQAACSALRERHCSGSLDVSSASANGSSSFFARVAVSFSSSHAFANSGNSQSGFFRQQQCKELAQNVG